MPENMNKLRRRLEQWDPKAEVEAFRQGRPVGDMSIIDPAVVFEDAALPDHVGETYRGYAGIARATEQWVEAFESVDIELERIEGSGDRLVSIHGLRMKARHTGIEFESGLAYVWTFSEGRVVHIQGFLDPAEALEVAGLSD
jgi:ketosteroid isomerase-like protein